MGAPKMGKWAQEVELPPDMRREVAQQLEYFYAEGIAEGRRVMAARIHQLENAVRDISALAYETLMEVATATDDGYVDQTILQKAVDVSETAKRALTPPAPS